MREAQRRHLELEWNRSIRLETCLLPAPARGGARAYIGPRRRYNTAVPAASPPPQPDQPSGELSQKQRPPKSYIYKLEAAGILIVGAVILMLILARYWHHIAWGVR